MTNDESLRLIKATEYCCVFWSDQLNEVVAVRSISGLSLQEIHRASAASHVEGASWMQVLESATISISALVQKQADIARHAEERTRWRRTLSAWRACGLNELLVLLETAAFPPGTTARGHASFLIDEIYYARTADLTSDHISRLEKIAAQRYFSSLAARGKSRFSHAAARQYAAREQMAPKR